ncbi:hypothetical protein JL721_10452 [Aureococcus anophagefferens]|nr:hypothetical protein JL721_10452 [Aureococcus anophagefferens]
MDGDGEDLATFESDAESRAYGEREMGTPVQYTRALDDEEEPETVAAPNFFVDGVAYRFADRALGCVPPSSEPRKRAVAVVVHPAFDAVILVAILVNAAFMGMVDYGSVGEDPDLEMYYKPKGGWRNDLIERAEIPFTALFLVEFVLKVFAMGFAGEEGAYLSDNWNLVDFVVVLTSVVELLPIGGAAGGLGALRAMRLLRPLRTLTRLFMGQLHGRCRTTPYPVVANYSLYGNGTNYADFAGTASGTTPKDCYWPLDEDDGRFCALHTGGPGLHKCAHATSKLAPDEWRWCGSNYDALGNLRFTPLKKRDAGDGDGPIESWFHAGAKQGDDSGVWSEDLNFGYTSLDNYLLGLVTIFQTITLEGWSDVMFMYEDAGDPTVAALFFTCMVIFGSFILLNLVLAVLENSLEEEDDGAEAPDPEYEAACRRADELHEAGKYKSPFQKAVLSEGFDYFFTLLIVGNTIVLAMDHKGIDPAEERLHELILFVLGVLFAVEMVLKIAALGLAPYFAVSFNRFDAFIVFLSVLEVLLAPPRFLGKAAIANDGNAGVLSALRALRIFRKTLGDVANIAGILMLFMYICALLGMQLFANRFRFDGATGFAVPLAAPGSSGRAAYAAADVPRAHFDDLGTAFVTIFQILTGENWNTVMYDGWRATGPAAFVFFFFVVVVGAFVVMQIFLAILLSNIMTVHEPETRDRSDTGREKVKAAQASRLADEERRKREAADATGLRRRALESALQRSDSILPLPDIRALGCLGPDNEFRLRVALLVDHPRFDQVILLLILVSTAFLAIDSPLNAPCSTLSLFLALSDWFFTPIFIMEMVLKVIAVGAKPYIGNGWNQLDFLVVATSTYGLTTGAPTLTCTGGGSSVASLKALRAMRAFLKGRLRHCGDARFWEASEPPTYASLEDAGDDTVFGLLDRPKAWVDMSSDEQAYFGPSSGVGDVAAGCGAGAAAWADDPYPCCGAWPAGGGWNATVPTAKELCRCWGYRWTPVVSQSFDNVFVATLSLFEMATTEGWIDVMYAAVDSTGRANMPRRDENPGWYAVFLIFMLVGSFLFLNLFVGVVCDSFEKMRGDKGGDILVTDAQQDWVKMAQVIVRLRPKQLAVSSTPALGFVAGEAFDNVIGGCILLNGVSLALPYFGQPDGYTLGTYVLGHCFSFIFFVEMVLKLLAFGMAYFTSNWNRFDFGLVTITLVGLPLEFTGSGASGIGGFARMLRLARTVRLARLIKRHKTMQKLCLTLVATVAYYGAHDEHVNFRSLGRAMLSLLRFATGENWNGFMHDVARRPAHCADDPEYDDDVCAFNGDAPGCVPVDGCGSTLIYPYLLSFSIVVAFVFVNLFIGVVLEGFNSADADDDLMISDEDYQRFRDGWAKIQSLELEIFELGEQDMDEGDEGEAAHVKFNDAILALAKHAHDTIVKVGSSSSTGAKRTALLRCFTEALVRGRGSSVDGRYALESPGVGDGYDDDEAKAPPNDYFFREPQEAPPSESPSWMPRGPPAPDSPHYADEAPDPPVDDGRVDLSYGGAALDGHAVARVLANCRVPLEALVLDGTFLGDRAARTVASALADRALFEARGGVACRLACLRELRCYSCGLGDRGAFILCQSLFLAPDGCRAPRLERLDVARNELGPEALDVLVEGVAVLVAEKTLQAASSQFLSTRRTRPPKFELDLSENAFFEGDARKALTALRALAKTMDDADGRMALALQCCGLGEAANSPDGPLAAAALRDLARADLEVLNLSDNNLGPRAVDPLASGIMVRFFDADAPRSRRSSRLRCDLRGNGFHRRSDATRPLYDILQKSWDRDDLPSHWVKLEDDGDDFYAPPPATPRTRAAEELRYAYAPPPPKPLTPELATYRKSRVHVADPDVARVLSGSPDGWHDLRWSVPGDSGTPRPPPPPSRSFSPRPRAPSRARSGGTRRRTPRATRRRRPSRRPSRAHGRSATSSARRRRGPTSRPRLPGSRASRTPRY